MSVKSVKRGCRRPAPAGGLMGVTQVFNGALTAAAATVLAILLLAVLLRYGIVGEGVIPVVNQVIKVLGIMLAARISVKTTCVRPWLRGLIAGMLYIAAGAAVFSLASGTNGFTAGFWADIAMGAVVGALAGLIFGHKDAQER